MYIQANIGRNITVTATNGPATATKPMDIRVWEKFQADTALVIRQVLSDELSTPLDNDTQTHTGMGEWDGVPEESAHVSIYLDHDGRAWDDFGGRWYDRMPDVRNSLSRRLGDLAHRYGQDAIAFIVTDSHLASR